MEMVLTGKYLVILGKSMIGIWSGWLPRFGMAFVGDWGQMRRIRGVMLHVVLCEGCKGVGRKG
jgi:hypothetical protein